MENKFLLLFFTVAYVQAIEATEKHGGIVVHHSPQNLHHMLGINHGSCDTKEEAPKLHTTSKDPYSLDELSDTLFNQQRYEEATQAFISSAIYGHQTNQQALAEIDPTSLAFLESATPESEEALRFYKETLTPQVISYLKVQYQALLKHKNTPVQLYNKL